MYIVATYIVGYMSKLCTHCGHVLHLYNLYKT